MKPLHLKQGSPEWLHFKRSHLGASDAPVVCGVDPYKTPYKLWKEKVLGESYPPTEAMLNGIRLEPHARSLAETEFETTLSPLCALHDEIPYLMASFDAINTDSNILVEIKCPGTKSYLTMKKEGVPKNYVYQVHQQMSVAGLDSAFLLSYCDDLKEHWIFEVNRDESIVTEIQEKAAVFYERMLNFEPPEDTHQERTDPTWQKLALDFLKTKEQLKELEAHLKECRDALIKASGNESCKGHGVTTTKYMTKGSVDYSKVPELRGVNLEMWRKPSRESWRVA